MNATTVAIIIASIMGSGGLTALFNAGLAAKRSSSSQWVTWNEVWVDNLDVMKKELIELRERVALLELALAKERDETLRLSAELAAYERGQ